MRNEPLSLLNKKKTPRYIVVVLIPPFQIRCYSSLAHSLFTNYRTCHSISQCIFPSFSMYFSLFLIQYSIFSLHRYLYLSPFTFFTSLNFVRNSKMIGKNERREQWTTLI